ncbi:hypothetical protein M408DRAFT_215228 [Serendipita vermifera MAFF 305830]|uniref:Uncharacterized protein n=1 Tax=Serendipita vermifera MAFF 305830 TaxID=933852 RepID=A0A0C2XTH5_SERVB|nr:hypothetical protein M408DRAFT_215228 [Serendipita vermifera MAFF 305830]
MDELPRSKPGRSESSMGLPPLSAFFTTRTGPMNEIIRALQNTNPDSPALAIVTGLSGTGKTQMSLKYAYDHDEQYDHILFIDASSAESLEKTLMSRIRSIDQQLHPESVEEAIDLLANPMGNLTRNWFIIMDNADNTEMDIRDYIPRCDHGKILVTSRNIAFGNLFPKGHIILDVMSNDEAVEALLSAALGPRESADADQPIMITEKSIPRTNEDYSCATRIVEELGYLPLAVIQAACYIKKQKCLHQYLNLLTNSRSQVLRWPASLQHDELKYAHSAYAAFDTTLGALSPRALQLLGIISFFHFSNFPKPLVGVAASYKFGYQPFELLDRPPEYQFCVNLLQQVFCPSGNWEPMDLDDLLEELQNYSLVSLVPVNNIVTLRFHPLLHGWANDRLSESDRELFRSAAVRLLACGTNRDDDYLREYLCAHMDQFSLPSEEFHVNDEAVLAVLLSANGNPEAALSAWKGIHAKVEAVYGRKHVRTTRAALQLADSFADNDDWETMERMEEEVVAIRKEILGEDHLETIEAMANLARTFKWRSNRYNEAATLEMEVLSARRKLVGPKNRQIVDALGDLAATRLLEEKYIEAESLLMEAMEMISGLVDKSHPATINVMSQLAKCYKRKGENEKMIHMMQEVARLQRAILGEKHSRTIEAMVKLAKSYIRQHQYSEAEKIWREITDVRRVVLGNNHQMTLISLYMQAFSVTRQDRHADSEALWRELLVGEQETYGERHRYTTETVYWLAKSIMAQKRYIEAEELLKRVIEARRELYEDKDEETLKALHQLALSIHLQGRCSDSEPIWRELLVYNNEQFGDNHKETLETMGYLHQALYLSGRHEESDALMGEMMVAARAITDPKDLIFGLHCVASALHVQSRQEDAATLWDEIVTMSRSIFGKEDPMTILAIEQRERVRKEPQREECSPKNLSATPGKISNAEDAGEDDDSSQ